MAMSEINVYYEYCENTLFTYNIEHNMIMMSDV